MRRHHSLSLSFLTKILGLLALKLFFFSIIPSCHANTLGGELAAFDTVQGDWSVSHRQNVCDRSAAVSNGSLELQFALKDLDLAVAMGNYKGAYFNYNNETGINPSQPGLAARLLDEVARRGQFRWRNSFGTYTDPGTVANDTWTDLLWWGVNTYDVSIDWWAQNLQRMNMGVAFLKEWYDSSNILITKPDQDYNQVKNEVSFWNWTRPYDRKVWFTTLFTIILSGFVFQWLEYMQNERDGRTMWEWTTENFFLSAINFSQNYEYGTPRSLASKVFGVSMCLWALVMTATYTANLASLLVDRHELIIINDMAELIVLGKAVCTWEGTNMDTYLRDTYPSVKRVKKKTLEEVYQGLRDGECEFASEAKGSWLQLKGMKQYNPQCNLEWWGGDRVIGANQAGFATLADSGQLCSGLIRDVINLHLQQMILDGFLDAAWEREYEKSNDIDCNAYRPTDDVEDEEEEESRRRLSKATAATTGAHNPDNNREKQIRRMLAKEQRARQRELKAGGKSAAASGAIQTEGGGGGEQELTLEQMFGTFIFHWALMVVSMAIAGGKYWWEKRQEQQKQEQQAAKHALTENGDTSTMHSRSVPTLAHAIDGGDETAELLHDEPAEQAPHGHFDQEHSPQSENVDSHDITEKIQTILERQTTLLKEHDERCAAFLKEHDELQQELSALLHHNNNGSLGHFRPRQLPCRGKGRKKGKLYDHHHDGHVKEEDTV